MTGDDQHTKGRLIRVPDTMWAAYGRVCQQLGITRTEDQLNRMRELIRERGTPEDLADLEAAQQELAERRSRKGGRPRKPT